MLKPKTKEGRDFYIELLFYNCALYIPIGLKLMKTKSIIETTCNFLCVGYSIYIPWQQYGNKKSDSPYFIDNTNNVDTTS